MGDEEECEASETQESEDGGLRRKTVALRKKKGKKSSCKRFSNEQVKSLETIFRLETKLETKKKLQVARDLGLQPRQVAIWFQNKRARWKSKQVEHDFRVLKAKFDHLILQFDVLKKENEALHMQSEKLRWELERNGAGHRKRQDTQGGERRYIDSDNKNEDFEYLVCLSRGTSHEFAAEDMNNQMKEEEEAEFLNLEELGGGDPFASPDQWCSRSRSSLNSPFDDSSCGREPSEWWEF
ncbi:unnamed protein product [Cuscuta epithymum]|uniref:Homeobox-leucine zipper protein n=1 Tax=Cuscuta epithymum TaxID=186058 RepID=A0AAV0E5V7_9ASTE|nr:unnamed protein product [Cuscuta epithymum]CAH9140856.1 unnamed protein product [Cuscuta epithymum]CAH9148710.1 unnamed protein product [Cuscuta epithymum]